jgi:CBS domain-containing protein
MDIPPVSKYMTRQPQTVHPACPVPVARELMETYRLRHLPVVEKPNVDQVAGATALEHATRH